VDTCPLSIYELALFVVLADLESLFSLVSHTDKIFPRLNEIISAPLLQTIAVKVLDFFPYVLSVPTIVLRDVLAVVTVVLPVVQVLLPLVLTLTVVIVDVVVVVLVWKTLRMP